MPGLFMGDSRCGSTALSRAAGSPEPEAYPDADGDEARTLRPLQAAAITYRIAFGPRAGHKLSTLQGALPREVKSR